MNKPKKQSMLTIETIIIIAITLCMLFLNAFTTNKLAELDAVGTEAMFIKAGFDYPESEQLGEEIIKYRPDSCKMIEMYDESFKLLFSLQFDESHPIQNNDINNYPDLINLLKDNKEGQTSLVIDGYQEEVYFQWITNNRHEDRLVMVYSTKKIVEDIWVFSLVCYIVIVLVFTLLIRLHFKNYKEKIFQYRILTNNVIDEVNRK